MQRMDNERWMPRPRPVEERFRGSLVEFPSPELGFYRRPAIGLAAVLDRPIRWLRCPRDEEKTSSRPEAPIAASGKTPPLCRFRPRCRAGRSHTTRNARRLPTRSRRRRGVLRTFQRVGSEYALRLVDPGNHDRLAAGNPSAGLRARGRAARVHRNRACRRRGAEPPRGGALLFRPRAERTPACWHRPARAHRARMQVVATEASYLDEDTLL